MLLYINKPNIRKTREILVMVFLLISAEFFCEINAQSYHLVVDTFYLMENDLQASTKCELDSNNSPCALLKFDIPNHTDMIFSGNIIKQSITPMECLVYVPSGTKKITCKNSISNQLEIAFAEFGIKIEGKRTYKIVLHQQMSFRDYINETKSMLSLKWKTVSANELSYDCKHKDLCKWHINSNGTSFIVYDFKDTLIMNGLSDLIRRKYANDSRIDYQIGKVKLSKGFLPYEISNILETIVDYYDESLEQTKQELISMRNEKTRELFEINYEYCHYYLEFFAGLSIMQKDLDTDPLVGIQFAVQRRIIGGYFNYSYGLGSDQSLFQTGPSFRLTKGRSNADIHLFFGPSIKTDFSSSTSYGANIGIRFGNRYNDRIHGYSFWSATFGCTYLSSGEWVPTISLSLPIGAVATALGALFVLIFL